jgi:NAD kinase
MRAFSPRSIPDSLECRVAVERSGAQAVVDGQFAHKVEPGDRVRVRKSARKLALVSPPHQNNPV